MNMSISTNIGTPKGAPKGACADADDDFEIIVGKDYVRVVELMKANADLQTEIIGYKALIERLNVYSVENEQLRNKICCMESELDVAIGEITRLTEQIVRERVGVCAQSMDDTLQSADSSHPLCFDIENQQLGNSGINTGINAGINAGTDTDTETKDDFCSCLMKNLKELFLSCVYISDKNN